jgi:hypothetical protein
MQAPVGYIPRRVRKMERCGYEYPTIRSQLLYIHKPHTTGMVRCTDGPEPLEIMSNAIGVVYAEGYRRCSSSATVHLSRDTWVLGVALYAAVSVWIIGTGHAVPSVNFNFLIFNFFISTILTLTTINLRSNYAHGQTSHYGHPSSHYSTLSTLNIFVPSG